MFAFLLINWIFFVMSGNKPIVTMGQSFQKIKVLLISWKINIISSIKSNVKYHRTISVTINILQWKLCYIGRNQNFITPVRICGAICLFSWILLSVWGCHDLGNPTSLTPIILIFIDSVKGLWPVKTGLWVLPWHDR